MDVARVMYMALIFMAFAYVAVAIPVISIAINEYTKLKEMTIDEVARSIIEVNSTRYANAEVVSSLMLTAGIVLISVGKVAFYLRIIGSYKLWRDIKSYSYNVLQIPSYIIMPIPICSIFLYFMFTYGLGYISLAQMYASSSPSELIDISALITRVLATLVSIEGIISIILVIKIRMYRRRNLKNVKS